MQFLKVKIKLTHQCAWALLSSVKIVHNIHVNIPMRQDDKIQSGKYVLHAVHLALDF